MGGLFGTLNASLDALQAFETALGTSQNNVSNVSTPGYARQLTSFQSKAFNINQGLYGGVQTGPTQSTQNEYANQAVRSQIEMQANYGTQASSLSTIESLFDVTGQTGVIGSLNDLFQSFSAWATTPSSTVAQQDVLSKAQAVADSFQSTSASLSKITTDLNGQISSTVQQINALGSTIQSYNAAILQNTTPDAGLDANLHAALESLSQLTDTTVRWENNGSVTVLIGGQTPLVIGQQQYSISASFADPPGGANANAVPNAHILDADGNDITSQITQGNLGGFLNVRNTVLPSLQGNGSQTGALNQIAKQVADRVNSILTTGQTLDGNPGTALFSYSSSTPVAAAQTFSVNPAITISGLAPVDPGPPPVGNGAALALSNLGNSTAAADTIGGQSVLSFLSSVAAQVGQKASDAQAGQSLHTQLLSQARALQDQFSGVSLDAEAVQVMELQKGYQAAGKMVSIIDSLTNTLINM